MCLPGAQLLYSGVQGLMSGLAARSDARWQADLARHEGRQAQQAADREGSRIGQQGSRRLAALRRAAAGSGNLSSPDFVADAATDLASDVAWARHGGAVASARASARAARAKQAGRRAVAQSTLGAATDLLNGGYELINDRFPSFFPII